MNGSTGRTFMDYLTHFSENYSPLDFVLIADHIDKFFYGTLLTLEITLLSLVIGGVLLIPLAIARGLPAPLFQYTNHGFQLFFQRHPSACADLSDLLRPRPVRLHPGKFSLGTCSFQGMVVRYNRIQPQYCCLHRGIPARCNRKHPLWRNRGSPCLRDVQAENDVAHHPTKRFS